MEWDRFEWMVRQQRLYMANLSNLPGDSFEGSTPAADLAWWSKAAADADTDEKRRIVLENRRKIGRFQEQFRAVCYISCWHIHPHENWLMWRAYTDSQKREAVAIRSTYARLRKCLPTHVQIGQVRYIDYERNRLPTMNLFEAMMHKRHYYAPEQELRAVAEGFTDLTPSGADVRANIVCGGYAPRIELTKLIEAVHVHPQSTTEFYARVKSLCVKFDLPKPTISGMSGAPVY